MYYGYIRCYHWEKLAEEYTNNIFFRFFWDQDYPKIKAFKKKKKVK